VGACVGEGGSECVLWAMYVCIFSFKCCFVLSAYVRCIWVRVALE